MFLHHVVRLDKLPPSSSLLLQYSLCLLRQKLAALLQKHGSNTHLGCLKEEVYFLPHLRWEGGCAQRKHGLKVKLRQLVLAPPCLTNLPCPVDLCSGCPGFLREREEQQDEFLLCNLRPTARQPRWRCPAHSRAVREGLCSHKAGQQGNPFLG